MVIWRSDAASNGIWKTTTYSAIFSLGSFRQKRLHTSIQSEETRTLDSRMVRRFLSCMAALTVSIISNFVTFSSTVLKFTIAALRLFLKMLPSLTAPL